METLELALQVKIEDGIRLIKHWLNNGYSLEFAISQFNASTTLGQASREQVYSAFN